MKRPVLACLTFLLLGVIASAQTQTTVFNNAEPAGLTAEGLKTRPRPAGGFYSTPTGPNSTLGYGASGTASRIGDDFTVSGEGMFVDGVVLFGYVLNSTGPVTSGQLEIRAGSVEGPAVAVSATVGSELTDIFRVEGVNPTDNRRIQRIRFVFDNVYLTPGSYWITFDVQAPPLSVFFPTLTHPSAATTLGANALRQYVSTGIWNPITDQGGPQDMPFWIEGSNDLGELITYDAAGRTAYRINRTNMQPTLAFSLPTATPILGDLAYRSLSGQVFASTTGTHELCEVFPEDNSIQSIGPFSVGTPFVQGLGWSNELDGLVGFASNVGGDGYYRISPISGQASLLGTTELGAGVRSLALAPNGVAYLVDSHTDSLYTLSLAGGIPTLIGNLQGPTDPQAATYDSVLGNLLVIEGNGNLWRVNPATAISTWLGDIGDGQFLGLYFQAGETLRPSQFQVTSGLLFGGGLASLSNPDDDKLFVLNSEDEPNAEILVSWYYESNQPNSLRLTLESSATREDLTEFVEIFDWNSQTYENLGSKAATISDTTVSYTTSTIGFASPLREVRGRVRVVPQTDLNAVDGWSSAFDFLELRIAQ